MRARDYAKIYFDAPNDLTLVDIANDMLEEISKLIETRHAKTNEAGLAILNEINDKWKAFARIVGNGVKKDGLENAIEHLYPNIYKVWKALS